MKSIAYTLTLVIGIIALFWILRLAGVDSHANPHYAETTPITEAMADQLKAGMTIDEASEIFGREPADIAEGFSPSTKVTVKTVTWRNGHKQAVTCSFVDENFREVTFRGFR